MNVLHINLSDYYGAGGTTIAMYRLHRWLNEKGYATSKILGKDKTLPEEPMSYSFPRPLPVRMAERALRPVADRVGLYEMSVLTSFNIARLPVFQEADVLNLHCIHGEVLNYLALPTLARTKPVVFTLHDLWGVTGQCHWPGDCEGFTKDCGNCPKLPPVRGPQLDGSRLQLRLKQWAYRNCSGGLRFVCPSRWIAEMARKSVFGDYPIDHVPYGLDTELFRPGDQPGDKEEACKRFGLPPGKRVLLFGCEHVKDRRKGLDLLVAAVAGLPEALKREMALLIVGLSSDGSPFGEQMTRDVGIPSYGTGFLGTQEAMRSAFTAADLFLLPTRNDNLPLVMLESLACGTPVVAFRVGGVPDGVRPGETGYLAAPENVEDFRKGIVCLLEDRDLYARLSANCRRIAVEEYHIDRMAREYVGIYAEMLAEPVPSFPAASFAQNALSE
jgi:glycosyltransferase involved in cell wall biosynthesis